MADDGGQGSKVRAFDAGARGLTLKTTRGEAITLAWHDIAAVRIDRRETPASVLLLLGALIGGMAVTIALGAAGPRLLLNVTMGLLFFPLILGQLLTFMAAVHLDVVVPSFILIGPLYGILGAFLFALFWDTIRFVSRPFVLSVATHAGRRFMLVDGGRERVETAARRLRQRVPDEAPSAVAVVEA